MEALTVPAGTYAVFTHYGPLFGENGLNTSYEYIYGHWLPQSGYELSGAPELELYDERFDPNGSPQSEMDLYVPINAARKNEW
jgi:AraC family transcriptional regulator